MGATTPDAERLIHAEPAKLGVAALRNGEVVFPQI